jgi:hypothetical protein
MSLVVQALQQVLAYIIEKETGLLAPRRPDGRGSRRPCLQ